MPEVEPQLTQLLPGEGQDEAQIYPPTHDLHLLSTYFVRRPGRGFLSLPCMSLS